MSMKSQQQAITYLATSRRVSFGGILRASASPREISKTPSRFAVTKPLHIVDEILEILPETSSSIDPPLALHQTHDASHTLGYRR